MLAHPSEQLDAASGRQSENTTVLLWGQGEALGSGQGQSTEYRPNSVLCPLCRTAQLDEPADRCAAPSPPSSAFRALHPTSRDLQVGKSSLLHV